MSEGDGKNVPSAGGSASTSGSGAGGDTSNASARGVGSWDADRRVRGRAGRHGARSRGLGANGVAGSAARVRNSHSNGSGADARG
jgi:hypothetical protein